MPQFPTPACLGSLLNKHALYLDYALLLMETDSGVVSGRERERKGATPHPSWTEEKERRCFKFILTYRGNAYKKGKNEKVKK